ncbi:MAG: UDP-4-amino-4,6-dideoxy-N-acetyl-beta-L-altrosamine transaminase [Mariniblastus sp.]
MLPYGKQTIEQDDIDAVTDALRSNWLTTGPRVREFEEAFAEMTSSKYAVALSSGTAALHAAMQIIGMRKNVVSIEEKSKSQAEVIVPAITFAATSNAAIYAGAKPVFADVSPETLLIDLEDVKRKITDNTQAIVAMDYAGQPCDYNSLRAICDEHDLVLISDACHSLGGSMNQRPVGSLADLTCFSLHPIKQITSGEGGIVTTDNRFAAEAIKTFRNHGITTDHRQREKLAKHQYAMETLGFNYRLTDIQCALGMSQLKKLPRFTSRRNEVAGLYNSLLAECDFVRPLGKRDGVEHAHHLYVIRWDSEKTGITRDQAFEMLRERGIGVNVHYQPVYQHPYYEREFGEQNGCCPNAESVYEEILSLPIFPTITEPDIRLVVSELKAVAQSDATSVRQISATPPPTSLRKVG